MFCLLRNPARALFSSRKPAVSKLGKWTNLLYTGVGSLAVGAGLCAVPFKQVSLLHYLTEFTAVHLHYMTNSMH